MKHEVNAMGKQCPIPVVMTKKVIDNAAVGDEIEILITQPPIAMKSRSRRSVEGRMVSSPETTTTW